MNSSSIKMPDLSSQEFDYARLIAELNAVVGFNDEQLVEVANSMGLELSEVKAIIDRADTVFEHAKASLVASLQR